MFETMSEPSAGGSAPAGVWPVHAQPEPVERVAWEDFAPDERCADRLWSGVLPEDDGWCGEAAAEWLPPDAPPTEDLAPWESLDGVEDQAPCGMLALVLEEVDRTRVSDRMLVEVVAAWRRIAAWAELNQALAAGELSRRASMSPQWTFPAPADENVAADELTMRLACSRRSAARLVRDGLALDNELLLAADAVRAGRLDGAQLRVITDRLADRPGELAWAVQEAVLDGATTRTPAQLAADVDRALLSVDPEAAADRLARAQEKRRVCHPKRLPDGMAGIWAVLPADEAVVVDATLDASARAAKALGSTLTLDQLRAETFTQALTGRAVLAGIGAGGTACAGDAPPIRVPRVRVNVTVAMSTLMGLDEAPGELTGFGPIPAEQARALAAGGVWRRLVTDPLSGRVLDVGRTRYRPPKPLADHVIARDGCCARPGCSTPADRCDLDHTTEYFGTPANGSPVLGTTSADNLGPLSGRCHRLKTDGGFRLRQVEPGVFEWRTPAGLAYRVVPGEHGRTERLGAPKPRHVVGPNPGYPDEPPF